MELHLLTYSRTLCYNAGYPPSHNAIECGEQLIRVAKEFAHEAGIRADEVLIEKGEEQTHGMVIFYAQVPPDWEPTEGTIVYDDKINHQNPSHVTSLWTWIYAKGSKFMSDADNPVFAHNLYRSKK
jgi:hypothetical protein